MLAAHREPADLIVESMEVYIEGVKWYTEPKPEIFGDTAHFFGGVAVKR